MADNDPYGLFGDDAATAPRKRTRSRTRARDVEQPSADQKVEDAEPADPYGLFAGEDEPATAPDADLKRGPAPGPAGSPSPVGGREHESAWYEPLLETGASFYQGVTQNTFDDTAAGYQWALDKLGLTHSGRSFEENRQRAHDILAGASKEHPLAHGAGQMATGVAAGAAVPQGVATQGLAQGVLSAGSEYADSGDWWEATKAGGAGLASGLVGSWLGNQAAKRLALVDPVKKLIRRGNMTPDEMVPKGPTPNILARGAAPREAVQTLEHADAPFDIVRGGMTPAEMAGAPTPDILARGGRPTQMHRELLDVDTFPESIVRGPVSAEEGAALGFRQPAPQGAVPRAPAEVRPGFAPGQQRLGGVPDELVPGRKLYSSLDDIDLPPPEPTTSRWGPPEPRRAPGDPNLAPLDLPPAPPSTTRMGPVEGRRVPSGPAEPIDIVPPTWDLASRAQKAAAAPPGAKVDQLLAAASHVPGLGLPARLGRAGMRMLGGPDVAAREAGVYLNDNARQLARGGFEAAWELGAPAAYGGKVNAQDGEQTAYATGPTLHYALSATLHAGRTGLPPADEQALTSAVVSGDDKAIAAIDFRLKQKYPAYARQVERQLRDLNEGDD